MLEMRQRMSSRSQSRILGPPGTDGPAEGCFSDDSTARDEEWPVFCFFCGDMAVFQW